MDKMTRRQALAAAGGLAVGAAVGAAIPAVAQGQEAIALMPPSWPQPDLYVNINYIHYVSTGFKKGGGHVTQVVLGKTLDRSIVKETMDDIMALVRRANAEGKLFIGLHKDSSHKDGDPVFEIMPLAGLIHTDITHWTGGTWIGGEALRSGQRHLRSI